MINVYCAVNQHIRIISEGSCDIEDWSNDAENSALITEIKFKTYLNRNLLGLFEIVRFHNITFMVSLIKNAASLCIAYYIL